MWQQWKILMIYFDRTLQFSDDTWSLSLCLNEFCQHSIEFSLTYWLPYLWPNLFRLGLTMHWVYWTWIVAERKTYLWCLSLLYHDKLWNWMHFVRPMSILCLGLQSACIPWGSETLNTSSGGNPISGRTYRHFNRWLELLQDIDCHLAETWKMSGVE